MFLFFIIWKGCGGVYSKHNGEIMSPNYPNSYPPKRECTWDLQVPNGYRINLTFIPPFDLEQSEGCVNDYVKVMDIFFFFYLSLNINEF